MLSVWLPVAIYVALIFTLSSIPNLSPPGHVPNSDKVAHFLEYGTLGWLLSRAWHRTWGRRAVAVVIGVVCVGGLTAAADELYQGTVAGRQQSLADWLTDLTGLLTALALAAWWRRRRGRA